MYRIVSKKFGPISEQLIEFETEDAANKYVATINALLPPDEQWGVISSVAAPPKPPKQRKTDWVLLGSLLSALVFWAIVLYYFH